MQTPSDTYISDATVRSALSRIAADIALGKSTALQFIGDGSSNESTEYAEIATRRLADEFFMARVPFYVNSGGSTPTTYGSSNMFGDGQVTSPTAVSRERALKLDGSLPRRTPNNRGVPTGDFTVSGVFQHASWRSAFTFGGLWNPAQFNHRLAMDANGFLSLFMSDNGSNIIEYKSTATVSVPVRNITHWRKAVRAVRKKSTGVVQFYEGTVGYNPGSSTESVGSGAGYTKLGGDVAVPVQGNAGAAFTGDLFSGVTASTPANLGTTGYTLGGYGTNTERMTGRAFNWTLQDADGAHLLPQAMDAWQADFGNTDKNVIEGPATLYVHNYATGNESADVDLLVDARRRIAFRPQHNGVCIVFTGANEATAVGPMWEKKLDDFYTWFKAWVPGMSLVLVNGYPTVTGSTTSTALVASAMAQRAGQTVSWGLRNNVQVIDSFRAMLQYVGAGNPITNLVSATGNGNDLTAAGKALLAEIVWGSIFTQLGR